MKVIHESHKWKLSMTVHDSQIATVSHFRLVFFTLYLRWLKISCRYSQIPTTWSFTFPPTELLTMLQKWLKIWQSEIIYSEDQHGSWFLIYSWKCEVCDIYIGRPELIIDARAGSGQHQHWSPTTNITRTGDHGSHKHKMYSDISHLTTGPASLNKLIWKKTASNVNL